MAVWFVLLIFLDVARELLSCSVVTYSLLLCFLILLLWLYLGLGGVLITWCFAVGFA